MNPQIEKATRSASKLDKQVVDKTKKFTSFQSQPVDWDKIKRKDGFYLTVNLFGDEAQTAANYSHFFTARYPVEIMRVSEVHATAGTDGSAVTLDVQKLTGTTAPGSGTSILSSTFNLKSTANTVVTKEGSALSSARVLSEGDRLCITSSGTLTAVASVSVTLYCKSPNRGDYR